MKRIWDETGARWYSSGLDYVILLSLQADPRVRRVTPPLAHLRSFRRFGVRLPARVGPIALRGSEGSL